MGIAYLGDVTDYDDGIGWLVKEGHWNDMFCGLGQMIAWYGYMFIKIRQMLTWYVPGTGIHRTTP